MSGLGTWDYVSIGGALVLVYVGHKHSGWFKYATWAAGAWLLYGVYQDYQAAQAGG